MTAKEQHSTSAEELEPSGCRGCLAPPAAACIAPGRALLPADEQISCDKCQSMCTEHRAGQASRTSAVSTWPPRNESGGARCVGAMGCNMDTPLQMEAGDTQEMRTQKGGRQGRPSQPQKHISLPLGRSHIPRDEVPTPNLFSREELSPPRSHHQYSRQRGTGENMGPAHPSAIQTPAKLAGCWRASTSRRASFTSMIPNKADRCGLTERVGMTNEQRGVGPPPASNEAMRGDLTAAHTCSTKQNKWQGCMPALGQGMCTRAVVGFHQHPRAHSKPKAATAPALHGGKTLPGSGHCYLPEVSTVPGSGLTTELQEVIMTAVPHASSSAGGAGNKWLFVWYF